MNSYKSVTINIGDEYYSCYKIEKLSDNTYIYEDDTCQNKLEILADKIIFTRENNEFLLKMDSNNKKAYYKLKELNYELDIDINYFDKRIEDDQVIISYQLETNDKEITLILKGE